jgi:hypothetical protein
VGAEDTAEAAVALVAANLPDDCGPAVVGNADDLVLTRAISSVAPNDAGRSHRPSPGSQQASKPPATDDGPRRRLAL